MYIHALIVCPSTKISGCPATINMFNSIQLFGLVLLGGLAAGEVSRRTFALPRTTGYVLFGLLVGQSGLNWVTLLDIESAQLFIDLALGLILFELGW